MLKHRVIRSIAVAAIILILCCGCQTSPDEDVIISKIPNSESMNYQSEINDSNKDTQKEEIGKVSYTSSFSSTDESVNFTLDIHDAVLPKSSIEVQVTPHVLTEDDIKRVSETLFPNAVFYEAEPERSSQYSKYEIQEKLKRWSPYVSSSALENLYGDPSYASTATVVSSFIEQYTLMLENAPESNPHIPCEWKFKKTSEYLLPAEELVGVDVSYDSDEISVQFFMDNIPYILTATKRDKSDFKVNMVACSIYDGLCPSNIDERIFSAKLCRTEEPTQSQMDTIKKKAEKFLSAFQLGTWKIDECYFISDEFGAHTEYRIFVNAVPVFDNVAALRRPQLSGLRNSDGHSAKQYFSDVQFVFAPRGELISFTLTTPLDVQNTHPQTCMSTDTLFTRAREVLTLTDSTIYGLGDMVQFVPEKSICNVIVTDVRYGLSRIKVPNQDNGYNYIPSLAFYGTVENVGTETGKTYYYSEKPELLLLLNALDGSMINDTNA